MIKGIKKHIQSNYIEISLILSFLLILYQQIPIIILYLLFISNINEYIAGSEIIFSPAKQESLFKKIDIIIYGLLTVSTILLFAYPSLIGLLYFCKLILITPIILGMFYRFKKSNGLVAKTMVKRAIILGLFLLAGIITVLTATNPSLLLSVMYTYFIEDILFIMNNRDHDFKNQNTIYSRLFVLTLTLFIIYSIPHSLVLTMSIYLAAPLVINTLEIILKTSGYEYSDSSFLLIPGLEPYKINFELNLIIAGKIIIFSSLFLSPTLMPIVMIIGCAIIAIDNILLNFDINLSTNKNKRQPQSIYSSIAIVLMPVSSLVQIPALLLPSTALCTLTTINLKINNIGLNVFEPDKDFDQNPINIKSEKDKGIFNLLNTKD